MKAPIIMTLAASLVLIPTIAGAQTFQGDGYPGVARRGAWQTRDAALQGPSAAERAWFNRASRSSGNGGF